MNRRKETMNDCVKVFVPDGRQHLQTDTVVLQLARRNVVGPAINRDLMPARNEPGCKVLRKGLKSAVTGGNAPRSENCNAHKLGQSVSCRTCSILPYWPAPSTDYSICCFLFVNRQSLPSGFSPLEKFRAGHAFDAKLAP